MTLVSEDNTETLNAPAIAQQSVEPTRKPTIMDVAAASGVSYATVSRYLNGNPHVSAKAARRIAAAVKATQYTPNNAARSLVRQRTQTVAFVVHGETDSIITDPNISTIMVTANQRLGDAGYQLVTLIADTPQACERIARLASSGFADGWILNSFHTDDALFNTFRDLNVPIAISGVGYGSQSPFPTVDIDNAASSCALTKHMRDNGYRRIAYICGPDFLPCSTERLAGFRTVMGDDFDPSLVVSAADWSRGSGSAAIEQLLSRLAEGSSNRPASSLLADHHIDALMCGNDCIAVGAMQYLMSHGVRIPDDLAIAGFDDSPDAISSHPQLTTVHQPIEQFGICMADMVLDQLEGRTPQRIHMLDTTVIERESTAR